MCGYSFIPSFFFKYVWVCSEGEGEYDQPTGNEIYNQQFKLKGLFCFGATLLHFCF